MIQRDELIKIGIFNKPHGVQGELAFTFTDDIFDRCESPYVVCEIDGIFVPFFIEEYRFRSDTMALMKLEDVDSEEEARPFTNLDVYYPKAYITNDEDGGLSAPGDFFRCPALCSAVSLRSQVMLLYIANWLEAGQTRSPRPM